MEKHERFRFGFLHLLALSGFALAQPIYDLLSRYPEFLVVHRVDLPLVLLLVFVVSFGLPVLLIALEGVARAIGPRLQRLVRLIGVGLLAAAFALQVLKQVGWFSTQGVIAVVLALALGGLVAMIYVRSNAFRILLSWLSLAAIAFILLFLLLSPARSLLRRATGAGWSNSGVDAPVVFVVFDELPLLSLLDEAGRIDAVRFPHFAALANEAYWFNNATTVSEGTLISLPAILDGKYPVPGRFRLPNFQGHPLSLFSLLENSHELHIFENLTQLAPPEAQKAEEHDSGAALLFSDLAIVYAHLLLPVDLSRNLPPITDSWRDFGREMAPPKWTSFQAEWERRRQQFEDFLAAIQPGDKPGLFFLHSMLPHASWKYLPDGRLYTLFEEPGVRGVIGANNQGKDPNWWFDDPWLPLQGQQRHLLQVGFVDTLLGELIARLKAQGIYDRCLLVVTADHGTAFLADDSRREITESNYPAILWVPLLIKAPGQREGKVVAGNVETVDILPTLLDLLDVDLDWKLDGRSAIRKGLPQRSEKIAFADKGRKFTFPNERTEFERFLRRRLQVFGAGSWDALFRLGDPTLLGASVTAQSAAPPDVRVELSEAAFLSRVDLESPFIPARISGRIVGGPATAPPRRLAVSVNGRIQAITQTSEFWGEHRRFAAVIPPDSLRSGSNRVEIYQIEPGNRLVRLLPVGGDFELLSDPTRLVTAGSQPVPLDPQQVVGWVVGGVTADGDRAFVGGWAADRQHLLPVQKVLVFLEGQLIASGSPRLPRTDAVSYLGSPDVRLSGFTVEFPLEALPEPLSNARIRVFGLSRDGVAAELNYPKAGPSWLFALP